MLNFDFNNDYTLENDKVKLSPLKLEHVEPLISISNEDELWTFMLEKGNGWENLTKYILSAVNKRKFKKEYPFIVFDKVKNEFAGTTRLYEYSSELKTIKLGHTWYGKAFRGTGLNKHCKYLLFEFVFDVLKLERIGFGAHADNKVSIAAMKSVGCKEEGVLRNFIPALIGKGRADIVLMSILKEEWQEEWKMKLEQKLNN
ncbi:GNAT family N-acetyltransferase [Seonamhaeicola marinus]|uniref:GNAT family N-acetyltransferase n=1 Tax=Seonamhaeicola marinus TaxID=1912246 RepID=A0A5D0HJ32_9FLAO|nr:GNAT family protein [Seonamhaeicola marinus]TYA70067.1 GNAT family N-acetyltransferase [Seonamhaeicola marinus]